MRTDDFGIEAGEMRVDEVFGEIFGSLRGIVRGWGVFFDVFWVLRGGGKEVIGFQGFSFHVEQTLSKTARISK